MNNQMVEAMKASGIPLPTLNQRIWTIIKDHGPISRPRVCSFLGSENEGSINAAISSMVSRQMLKCIVHPKMAKGKRCNTYEALGRTYMMLPYVKKTKLVKPTEPIMTVGKVIPVERPAVRPAVTPSVVAKLPFDPKEHIKNLTIYEVRDLFVHLKNIFTN